MVKNRLENVADLIHEDIMDSESDNDTGIMIDKLTAVESCITAQKKLEVERLRIEAEKPPEKTGWDKFIDFGKAWGGVIAGTVTVAGVVIHEIINRKNLADVTEFEENGSFRSTGFRKWIK